MAGSKFFSIKYRDKTIPQSKKVPAYACAQTETVQVAAQPPLLEGAVIETHSCRTFSECEGITFSECALIEQDDLMRLWQSSISTNDYVLPRVHHPRQFIIADMEGELGKGLFLGVDEDPISPGEIVLVGCGGEFTNQCDGNMTYYLTGFNSLYGNTEKLINKFPYVILDATSQRGYASYIQFSPDTTTLKSMEVDERIKDYIQPANVIPVTEIIENVPVLCFYAIHTISPGQPILWCYDDFLKTHNLPELNVFNFVGLPIGKVVDNQIVPLEQYELRCDRVVQSPPTSFALDKSQESDFRYTYLHNLSFFLSQNMKMHPAFSLPHQLSLMVYQVLLSEDSLDDKVQKLGELEVKVAKQIYQHYKNTPAATLDKLFGKHLNLKWLNHFLNRLYVYKSLYLMKCQNQNTDTECDFPIKPINLAEDNHIGILFVTSILERLREETDDNLNGLINSHVKLHELPTVTDFYKQISALCKLLKKQNTDTKRLHQDLVDLSKRYNIAQTVCKLMGVKREVQESLESNFMTTLPEQVIESTSQMTLD